MFKALELKAGEKLHSVIIIADFFMPGDRTAIAVIEKQTIKRKDGFDIVDGTSITFAALEAGN